MSWTRRRLLAGGLSVWALAVPMAGRAQPRLPRIVLSSSIDALAEAFVAGLRDHGWIEGRNIAFERVSPPLDQTMPKVLDQLLSREPNVLVLAGAILIGIAAKLAKRTPLVGIDLESDPAAAGRV